MTQVNKMEGGANPETARKMKMDNKKNYELRGLVRPRMITMLTELQVLTKLQKRASSLLDDGHWLNGT